MQISYNGQKFMDLYMSIECFCGSSLSDTGG